MTPRTKEQNEAIRLRRVHEILRATAEVYLDKGILLEIRDVASAAGLGYGTVYHYYNNKNDLVSDMLYQGLERAMTLWTGALSPAGGTNGGTDGGTNGGADAGSEGTTSVGEDAGSRSEETASLNVMERLREACAVLLHAWERDRALFLACHLGADQYRMLQRETAARLSPVYRSTVLLPLASRVEAVLVQKVPDSSGSNGSSSSSSDSGSGSSDSGNSGSGSSSNSEPLRAEAEREAEWLLAALAACALPSIRRGTLKGEMEELIRFAVGRGFA